MAMNEDRFIELLLKDLSEEITPEEREEFQLYLADDQYLKRRQLFKLYWSENSMNAIDNEKLFQKLSLKISEFQHQEEAVPDVTELRKRHGNRFRWYQVAAVVALCLCSVFFYKKAPFGQQASETQWTEKVTPRGRNTSFTLSDGTRIFLNSASKLRFPVSFSGPVREVYLSGEAFFDVKKDPAHPFIIHTDKMNVKVLGTAFNVKAYPDEPSSETTLIRGSVEVTLKDRPQDKVVLKPTEKFIINYEPAGAGESGPEEAKSINKPKALSQVTYMQKEDSSIVETSWMQNKLIFKDQPLEEVCRSLERWYNYNIRITKEQLRQPRITVTFQGESIQEALKALQSVEPFHYKIEGNTVSIF